MDTYSFLSVGCTLELKEKHFAKCKRDDSIIPHYTVTNTQQNLPTFFCLNQTNGHRTDLWWPWLRINKYLIHSHRIHVQYIWYIFAYIWLNCMVSLYRLYRQIHHTGYIFLHLRTGSIGCHGPRTAPCSSAHPKYLHHTWVDILQWYNWLVGWFNLFEDDPQVKIRSFP